MTCLCQSIHYSFGWKSFYCFNKDKKIQYMLNNTAKYMLYMTYCSKSVQYLVDVCFNCLLKQIYRCVGTQASLCRDGNI